MIYAGMGHVVVASYDPVTGLMEITIGNHTLSQGTSVKLSTGAITFKCNEDNYSTEHPYPRTLIDVHTATTGTTYNPTTGAVTGSDTNVSVKGVILNISSSEDEGLYQTTDVKMVIGSEELGDYYPTEADRVQYPQAGATREGKIIDIK